MSRPFYGYGLAGYSFAILFCMSSFFLHSRGLFFPVWMAEFAVDKTQISLVVSLVLFCGACLAPLFGYFLDRYPLKVISSVGALWLTMGYCLLQWADEYWQFLATLLIFQSVGWVCLGPLAQTKLMVNWFSRNRGMALGVAIMGISVAGVVMPTVVTLLLGWFGWRDTYLLYAGVLLLGVLPATLLWVQQKPQDIGLGPDGDEMPAAPLSSETVSSSIEAGATAPSVGIVASYREFLTSKAFWSVVVTFGLMNGVYSAMITHLPTYLTQELDFTLYDASYVLGLAGLFAIIGKLVYGWLMDHADAKRTVLAAVLSYFLSTLVFMYAQSLPLLMVAGALFGLGFGGMVPVRSVLLSRLFGVHKFSRVNGLLSFFLAPATFWVLITGYVADQSGTYTTAFQIWACAFLLAGVISAVVRLPNHTAVQVAD